MRAVHLLSAGTLALSLVAVGWTRARGATTRTVAKPARELSLGAPATVVALADGSPGVIDANGVAVPARHYQRVASASTTADALLLALLEPERITGLTDYGRRRSDAPHAYGSRLPVVGLAKLQPLLDERVDLVVTNHTGPLTELSHVREAGIQLFNLGEMRGLETLVPSIHALASLLGQPERGRYYATQLVRRMRMVAADIPFERRKRALYVTLYDGQLLGAAGGTSHHDVLQHAGLIDVAAAGEAGFRRYEVDDVRALDPDVLVTNAETASALLRLCDQHALRACRERAVVALPAALLGDPGPRMLEASEALRVRIYGEPR